MTTNFSQAAADRIDYDISLISSDSDTAASVGAVVVSPAGALTVDGSPVINGAKVKVWLKNGVQGTKNVQISVPITTTLGRVKTAIFYVSVT